MTTRVEIVYPFALPIIPRPRMSACTSNGRQATILDYYREGATHTKPNVKGLATSHRPHVRRYGNALMLEIFDTVRPGVRFNVKDLVDETVLLRGRSPRGQEIILYAVLRWMVLRGYCAKVGRGYVLPLADQQEVA